ncbi:MAG TPA: hypothetical protein DD437_06625 [Rhodobiaceae bacterium]|nr:hypothetical protein [Rhodobiaceae bacterium]
MRHIRSCAWIGIFVILTGCGTVTGFPERPVSDNDDLDHLVNVYFSDGFDAAYTNADLSTPQGVASRRDARNNILNGRLAAFDIQFNRFQRELHSVGVGTQLSTDTALLGLGAAGAVVSGGTSQLLSAIAGGITGFQGSVDREVFFEQTMPVLLQQMNAQRNLIRAKIRAGLLKSVTDYPLGQGLADIESYYFAGSIPGALVGISDAAGKSNDRAQAIEAGTLTAEAVTDEVISGAGSNIEKIQKLSDERAIRLALILENTFPEVITIFRTLDSANARFTDGRVARDFITRITPTMNRTIEGVTKLNKAIETVSK